MLIFQVKVTLDPWKRDLIEAVVCLQFNLNCQTPTLSLVGQGVVLYIKYNVTPF